MHVATSTTVSTMALLAQGKQLQGGHTSATQLLSCHNTKFDEKLRMCSTLSLKLFRQMVAEWSCLQGK